VTESNSANAGTKPLRSLDHFLNGRRTKKEIGHVLFIDIVGYSKQLIDEQRDYLHTLTMLPAN
jgi:hypothetical protein